MATFTNQTKHTSSFSNQSKNSSSWDAREKSGKGWTYNDNNMTYNQDIDPDTGDIVFYNGLGLATSWGNLAKS